MALYRALITLDAVTNNPDDVSTNTLYFDVDSVPDLLGVSEAIEDLYQSMQLWWSDRLQVNGHTIQFYQLSDPEPRRPVAQYSLSLGDVRDDTLPTECAMCLSYQAAPVSGLPQARRRGRIYVGPLAKPVCDANGFITPVAAQDLQNGASALLDASDSALTWTWSTYSPTDNQGHEVKSGWVDNAFDTQRRRGREATQRYTFANP